VEISQPLPFDMSGKSNMATLSLFATASDSRVDAENGIIRGVRVITKGDCKGHSFLGAPMIVDDTTIEEVVTAAAGFRDGVPVKLAHGTDIEELVGSIRDIVSDGDCARGDLYLLKSHENFETIIEMAQTMPSNFGISISFMNAPEPVKGADMEPDGDEDDSLNINPAYQDDIVAYAARVCELYSADLVANPATGDGLGLFSQPSMSEPTTPEAPVEEIPAEVIAPEVVAEPVAESAPEVPEVAEVAVEATEESEPEVAEAISEEVVAIPAPAELSRSWNAVSTDLEATRTELSAIRCELSRVQTDLAAARGEIAIKEAQLVELNMLHRSVLSVMGLSASIEVPEIVETAQALSIMSRYEAMPSGPARLSFFQANRREIERSLAEKLK
jgi:hypothetical protein